MKKLVNGKVINIENIELFEKGFEGLVLNKKASSDVKDTLDSDNELVKQCVTAYNNMINTLPFPLFAIESNCKYAFIANYILNKVEGLNADDIFVNECICIKLEDNKQLKLMYKTWAIEKYKGTPDTAKGIDLEQFKNEAEYKELKWCYDKLVNGESISAYYKEFMKSFIDACSSSMTLNWELKNILNFGYVPEEIEIDKNRILNPSKKYQYFLDVFCTGKKKTNDSILEIVAGPTPKLTQKNKLVKVYDFDVYGKLIGDGDIDKKAENKIEKKQLDGMASVFEVIVGLGIDSDTVERIVYRGIIDDDIILFEINGKIYQCKSNEYTHAELLAVNVSIYSYENGRLYIKNSTKLPSGVYRDNIFSVDVNTKKARLCRTSFRQ